MRGAATDCCATPRIRGPRSEAWSAGNPWKASRIGAPRVPSIEAERAEEATLRPIRICHLMGREARAALDRRRPDPDRRARRSGSRRRAATDEQPAAPSTRAVRASTPHAQQLAGAPAPLAGAARAVRPAARGRRAGVRAAARRAEGHAGRDQQVGVVVRTRAGPSSRPSSSSRPKRGKEIAFLGVNAGDSTQPARDFLARVPDPVPVLPRPGREDRACDQGAGELPDHGVRRRARQDGVHPPGRLRQLRAGARGRRRPLLGA